MIEKLNIDRIFKDLHLDDHIPAETEFESCLFERCEFSGSDLSACKFIDCQFDNCNLSNVPLEGCSFQNCHFKECKLLGLGFDKCRDFNFSIHFIACQLNHSVFYQCNLKKCSFVECQLQGVDFAEADLSGIALKDCDLSEAIFDRSKLAKSDLRNSFSFSIDPDNNNIKGAKFSQAEIHGLLLKYGIVIE